MRTSGEHFSGDQGSSLTPPEEPYHDSPDEPFLADQPDEAQEVLDSPDTITDEFRGPPKPDDTEQPNPDTRDQGGSDKEELTSADKPNENSTPSGGQPPAPPGTPPPPSSEEPEPERQDILIEQNLGKIEHLRELLNTVWTIFDEGAALSEAMEGLIERKLNELDALEDTTLQAILQAQNRRKLDEKESTLLEELGQPLDDPESPEEREGQTPEILTWAEQAWSDLGNTDIIDIETPIPPDPGRSMQNLTDLYAVRADMYSRVTSALPVQQVELINTANAFEKEVDSLRQADPNIAQELASDINDARARMLISATLLNEERAIIRDYFNSRESQDRRNTSLNPFQNY